jgi:hypothetical protein
VLGVRSGGGEGQGVVWRRRGGKGMLARELGAVVGALRMRVQAGGAVEGGLG